ncbi:dimethylallyl, adenosine tRNA methylthiotransferase [Trema orientale]|uniref:Dimethylallyl, adenosine tRNA methylthiotransferase n=1 Tax=Trema orientale TaxID=63057 RepID=A0A2P5FLW5_TREOI|nr:dimethylallyl, adenosine tRNA methylthiotransferase [Trema orientale]
MARGGEYWGNQGRAGKWGCSYKRTTLIVCLINILVALFVLRSLYASLYIYPDTYSRTVVKYTPDQIRKMEESIWIRREAEPVELVKLVKKFEKELSSEVMGSELPQHLKQSLTEDVIQRLKTLGANANISEQREAVERWRKEKLNETKQLTLERGAVDSTIPHEEADMLARALESSWAVLCKEIGLWIPPEIINQEHNDKPEGEEESEDDILPGRPVPAECHAELHTDYDGAAVRWGLTFHRESAADCCQACLDQAKHAKALEKKCNIWVYCPSEEGCYSPDIYQHKQQECWLKYAEKPKLNFKDKYPESYRNSHPTAPFIVPWVSGVISA